MDIPATSDNIPGTLVLRDSSSRFIASELRLLDISSSSQVAAYVFDSGDAGVSPMVDVNVTGGDSGSSHILRIFRTTNTTASVYVDFLRGNNTASSTARINCNGGNSYFNTLGGSVGIGTNSPNAAAALDVSSTVGGFLPPRMTTTQRDAITSPPAGLMLYNSTTNKLQVRTDTAWVDLH